jgi:hypothetical protein
LRWVDGRCLKARTKIAHGYVRKSQNRKLKKIPLNSYQFHPPFCRFFPRVFHFVPIRPALRSASARQYNFLSKVHLRVLLVGGSAMILPIGRKVAPHDAAPRAVGAARHADVCHAANHLLGSPWGARGAPNPAGSVG